MCSLTRPHSVRNRTKICDTVWNLAVTLPFCCRNFWGVGMPKLKDQLLANNGQVREAERRLAIQHTFIERLRASAKDTRAAEEALEVMRDILRGLYLERSQLRRKQSSRTLKKPTRATKARSSAGARNDVR
jgi:hypothetical protein